MDLFSGPTKIIDCGEQRRCCGQKPKLDAVAWFRDHIYWHRESRLDADNISFTLEQDPGKNVCLINGVLDDLDRAVPRFGCAVYGSIHTTLATTRRNELLFRYRHGDMTLPGYPFPSRHFSMTPHFRELLAELALTVERLSEPGAADRLDLLALELMTEASVSSEKMAPDTVGNVRFKELAYSIRTHPERDLNIERLASEMGMSRASFYRQWAKISPESPYHMQLVSRIRLAEMLLKETTFSLKEIAERIGFHSASVFEESFLRLRNVTPRKYRKRSSDLLED